MKSKMAVMVLAGLISTAALAEERFGIGALVGEPTGVSAKYWLDEEHAVDAAAGWSFWDGDGFQLQGDFLWHNFDVFGSVAETDALPLYFGVGARLKFREDEGRHHDDHDAVFGLRVPVGVSYQFDNSPFEVFGEIAPLVDLTPDFELNFSIAVGFRYYLQ
jgi:hypothetical protein